MNIKCSCGEIFNCDPRGNCWCKQVDNKIKKSDINKKNTKCLCEDCLNTKINRLN